MTAIGLLQFAVFLVLLLGLAWPLGAWMTRVYEERPCGLDRVLGPVERLIHRAIGPGALGEQDARTYAGAFLAFQAAGLVVVLALQSLQHRLPFNPDGRGPVPWHLAINTAVSFVTNTNWQSYAGEATLSHLTQAVGLAVQNFVSAAAGMAILVALIRGLSRDGGATVGNFWRDLVRSTLYVLLPLSLVLAVALVAQGVPQSVGPALRVELLDPVPVPGGDPVAVQTVPLGPAASQVAVKQLGTNGGGFYGANAAHPLENPTPLSNLLQCLAILLLPAALCRTFGGMVGDERQGRALFAVMLAIFLPLALVAIAAEGAPTPALDVAGLDAGPGPLQDGGNTEGKEARFTSAESALWATATTAASNGSVNAQHDSFSPIGGLVPLLLINSGGVVFGGVGSGLYGLLVFAIVAAFCAGLMVGRTPEYLGKKLDAYEMRMAALAILAPSFAVLVGAAAALATGAGRAAALNPGPHGFSEILYAYSSAGNNNGSAFAGLATNTPFHNLALAAAMLLGRYGCALPVLALAGSLARKRRVAAGSGTLPTHGPLFVALLVAVVIVVGALTFAPALALGPVAEHLAARR